MVHLIFPLMDNANPPLPASPRHPTAGTIIGTDGCKLTNMGLRFIEKEECPRPIHATYRVLEVVSKWWK